MSPLRQYKNITFPVNPLYVHTPDSIGQNAAGLVTSWNDESGNNNHANTIAAGSHRISNQNSLSGLQPAVSSSIQKPLTLDRGVGTVALLVQRSTVATSLGTSCFLWFQTQSDLLNDQYIFANLSNQISFSFLGSTNTTISAPTYPIGQYVFIIVRYNLGDVNYYINNVSTNASITKLSTPTTTSRPLIFYDCINNTVSNAWIHNLSAYWNRELTDAECLELSKFVYMMSNGAVGDNPNTLTKYKEISFPTGASFIHTPDSIQTAPTGLVTSWKDVSGNNSNFSSLTAACRVSNQNSVKGIEASPSTAIIKTKTLNPIESTIAVLVQRNSAVKAPITLANAFLYYMTASSNLFAAAVSTTTLTITNVGATSTDVAVPLGNLGTYCFLIVRYNNGNANYYLNNTVSNPTISKVYSPTFISESYSFYAKISNIDSDKLLPCFSAYWTRNLSDAECLSLSNYVYNITNGAVGDAPINTALISNLQSQLGVI